MSDHVHDENCDHEHEDMVFVVTDEDGNEHEMVLAYTFETGDKAYAVLLDRNEPEDDGVIFRIEEEGEDEVLVNIEDDEEWERVMKVYEELVAQEAD
ncbi:DUF1292 domain-containing protein [Cohnella lubricantis]|uniref:DUF1292 domain-containing protein n=1 Tax=Cohnella lubricantis TaxID=2163172 RepID=A0A841TB04_9BACL|nr:DUF1292 domain-containing protein [Cohnella lubricantis]MBB6677266.1 DUF1292 domain-containing protein [Cohnella lubricantis]MBP2116923.1 uncharacterized protein YrzB (UPF0473 family) [Cohnella lubricantis]